MRLTYPTRRAWSSRRLRSQCLIEDTCRRALCWTAEVGVRIEEVTLAPTDKLSNSSEALLLASQDRSGCNEYDEVSDGVPSTRTELPTVARETFVTNLCRTGVCHIHCRLDDDQGVGALSRVSSALPVYARLRQQIKIKCTWPFAGSTGSLRVLRLRIILPGLRCLCAVHLLIWDRRGRPALPSVRVEYSLVLAMEPPAHALDGLPACL